MKNFKSFVTKRSLDEAVQTSEKTLEETLAKILYSTLTQDKLKVGSSSYKYFYGEVEDNVTEINHVDLDGRFTPNIDIFVNFFSNHKIFKSFNQKIIPRQKTENNFKLDLENAWKLYRDEALELKAKSPEVKYVVPPVGFFASVLKLLTCSKSDADIVKLFTLYH